MGKQRSSLRQVPWQSWEHWDWVATELFSESPERISGALDRIAAWQSRGKVPIAVETSAAIIGIHQRDPQFNHGILKESALPEAMLRMMYAMAIQRLVNGVVDPSQKRNTTSVADRAEFAGLSRLLVDIRHEAAHTELPGLALLQVASRQALAWLKSQYWDQQKETLLNVRLELKSKLVEHCLLVVDILNPSPTASELQESEGEHESKSEELPELVLQGSLRVKQQQRKGLFNELLDLSLSSIPDLISTLVDDGLLEQYTVPTEDAVHSAKHVRTTYSTDGTDLTSATDSAWKFTLRELSSHLPRLPEMLLVAIVKRINKSCARSGTSHWSEEAGPTRSQQPELNIDELTDPGSKDSLRRNRLISWCAWLLGSRSDQASEDLTGKESRKSKLLKISNSIFVRTNLSKEILAELLRLCLSTANGHEPLVDLLSLIAIQLGSERFQHRVAALAQLGSSMQRLHRNVMDTSESLKVSASSMGEAGPQGGSSEKVTASTSLAAGDNSILGSEPTMEPAVEIARRQQRAFLARFSSQKKGVQSTRDRLGSDKQTTGSALTSSNGTPSPLSSAPLKDDNTTLPPSVGLRQERSEIQIWTVVENWRPCAIGMIPSPCHSLGILPSLDLKHVHGTQSAVPMTPEDECHKGPSTSTNAAGRPVDLTNLATAGIVEPVVGKRTTDEQLDGSERGKKVQKPGRHVHFEDESRMDVDEANASGLSSRGRMTPNQAVGHQQEQTNTGSLLQGCLLQQGILMPVTPQQFESLQATVHVL
ncbi:unnamed protein product [Calypogeia fissa]